jgi:hypothetical protein
MTYTFHGLGSSVSQVPGMCDAEVARLRAENAGRKRTEVGLILGGAAVSLTSYVLTEAGYPKVGAALSISTIIVGAVFAAVRLSSE